MGKMCFFELLEKSQDINLIIIIIPMVLSALQEAICHHLELKRPPCLANCNIQVLISVKPSYASC